MVNTLRNVDSFLEDVKHSFRFFLRRLRYRRKYGKYEFSYNEVNIDCKVNILANGPSLKDEINKIKEDGLHDRKNCVVNFFANSPEFLEIKPEFYCVADSAFFGINVNKPEALGLIESINRQVVWNMTLVVPVEYYEIARAGILNHNINIVAIPSLLYEGFSKNKYLSFFKGKAAPSYVNVTIFALFYFLNTGVKEIYLYGVDHTFTQNLAIDDENFLCVEDNHFYGRTLRRVNTKTYSGEIWDISDFLYDKYLTFREHKIMQGYASFLNAKIINCTERSLIDAYPRLAQIKKHNQE